MSSRTKHGLRDLWWYILCVAVTVTILCTSMLAGRRLSSKKSTTVCPWLFNADESPSRQQQQEQEQSQENSAAPALVDQVVLVIIDALTPRVALGPDHALRRQETKLNSRNNNNNKETESGSASSAIPRESGFFTYIRDELEQTATVQTSSFHSNSSSISSQTQQHNKYPALGFFSVADAPTTTAQRTKAMVTGTIPVLLEAGASFNSFTVEEDNLLSQLKGRVAVLGDDTWVRLFPEESHWQSAYVYESFDVRDLHTVDNGVLDHLQDVLDNNNNNNKKKKQEQEKTSSDDNNNEDDNDDDDDEQHKPPPKLIIAHFLGVDHAGHQYHARDPHLAAKVDQLNQVLRNVSQFLIKRAESSSSSSSNTAMSSLLLVMGDHGMTESGDHGGSTPSETDTFLFSQLFPADRRESSKRNAATSFSREKEKQKEKETDDDEILSMQDILDLGHWFTQAVRAEHCGTSRLCRIVKPKEIETYCKRAGCASLSSSSSSSEHDSSPLTAIHQIDLVPTLSAILGVPIPKQNLGRLVPELVLQALVSFCADKLGEQQKHNKNNNNHKRHFSSCTRRNVLRALSKMMKCNVDQLHDAFCAEFSSTSDWYESFCSRGALAKLKRQREEDQQEERNRHLAEDEEATDKDNFHLTLIKNLDQTAAQLCRAAREALTDIDITAVLLALAVGFYACFSFLWQYLFSQPTCWRNSVFSARPVMHTHAAYNPSQQDRFKPGVRRLVINWALLVLSSAAAGCFLFYVVGCRSLIALCGALPMLFASYASTDGASYVNQFLELFYGRFSMSSAASIAFLFLCVRSGVHQSNSFIVREDVISCAMTVTGLLICHHLQLVAWRGTTAIKKQAKGRVSVIFKPVVVLAAIAALALALGKRVRDFDSHFVEAQSLAQKIHAAPIEWVMKAVDEGGRAFLTFSSFSSSTSASSARGASSSPSEEETRRIEAAIAARAFSESRSGQVVAVAREMTTWLFHETPFVHVAFAVTLVTVVLVAATAGVFVFSAGASSSSAASTRYRCRSMTTLWLWRIFFCAAFVWNVTVSNVTSRYAFVLQCLFLLLWCRWFPLSEYRRHVAIDSDNGVDDVINTEVSCSRKDQKVLVMPSTTDLEKTPLRWNSPLVRQLQVCSCFDALVLHLCGWLFFFASGSQCMFSTIDWNIAFVGVPSVNFVAGGVLLIVHTLRPFIVCLVVAIYVDQQQRRPHVVAVEELKADAGDDGDRRDQRHHHDDDDDDDKSSPVVVVGLGATLIFINTCLCMSMCYSMTRHRGHLMTWEVFFPRFAVEVGVFLMTVVGTCALQVMSPH